MFLPSNSFTDQIVEHEAGKSNIKNKIEKVISLKILIFYSLQINLKVSATIGNSKIVPEECPD